MAGFIRRSKPAYVLLSGVVVALFSTLAAAQRIAVLAPDASVTAERFRQHVEDELDGRLRVVDGSLADAAFRAAAVSTPFNMRLADASRVGRVIGSDAVVLLKADTLRRSASGRAEYYEAFASVYVFSSRTGHLLLWRLPRSEAQTAAEAERSLMSGVADLAAEISSVVTEALRRELTQAEPPAMEEPPEPGTQAAKNFRAPVPYRRVKPQYTEIAAFYDIAATVEIAVDLDSTGRILRTEIVRWAGYGLDGSAESAVRTMNWRPAERDGKGIPMRFLIQYNFKKLAKPVE